MPSLQALGEFKSSFFKLGNEEQTMLDLDLVHDDLPLPNHEPANIPARLSDFNPTDTDSIESDEMFENSLETEMDDSGTDFINSGDLGDLLGGMDDSFLGTPDTGQQDPDLESVAEPSSNIPDTEENFAGISGEPAGSGGEDTEFSNFIDNIPDDFTEPPEDQGLPPGLLNGFADEIEAERSSPGKEDTELWDIPTEVPDEASEEPQDFAAPESEILPGEEVFGNGLEDFDLDGMDLSTPEEAGTNKSPTPQGLGNIDLNIYPSLEPDKSLELHKENPMAPPAETDESIPGDEFGEEDPGEELGDMDFGEESLPDDGFGLDSQDSEEREYSDLDLGDLPDFDTDDSFGLPDEETTADIEFPEAEESTEEALSDEDTAFEDVFETEKRNEDFPLDDNGEMELSGEDDSSFGMAEDSSSLELEDGFNLGEEASDFDTSATLEEISGDSFDNFNLDANALAGDFDLAGGDVEDLGDGLGSLDDFSLSGIDSVFDGRSPSAGTRTGGVPGRAQALPEEMDEVEEIRLTNEELEQFQTTLSSYPLNLRVACEELIVEQAVSPDLMSRLVKLLIRGASAKETAALAGQILGRTIPIPKGFEKKTGEELEAEQSSFAYIFVHNFLPVFRLFLMIALVILSAGYLTWRFIYTPLRAEKIYRLGYERIGAGEYARANERFIEAFKIHEKKSWFYEYARAFRDAKQYTLAEDKYRELLYYTSSKNKRYIPEKKAVLEFADMETNTIGNYETAEEILLHNLIDFYPFDREGLLALGDNSLAWGESEPSRLENAREYFARYMERYGRSDPLLERMLKYFIRTDNLEEVLQLQAYFMGSSKRTISSAALAELGGYLLDKRYEKVRGVPNLYLDSIGGIREILLRAVRQDPMLPETYHHLARYYNYYDNFIDERLTLELAVRVFDAAKEESPKRIRYHILTLGRYGELLIESREFFPAEENLIKAIGLFQDGLSRRLLKPSPEFGKLYASLGDLEYFVKDGDMRSALDYYRLSEQYGWAPPEIQYRMGAAHYQLRQWGPALERIFAASREMAPNRRILYALGNVSYMRGNYFAAQGYYDRLLEILEADRSRLPPIMPTDDEKQLDLVERLMVAQNNQGVTLEGLTERTGNNRYRSRAQGLYADSQRAWDILTRNPVTMTRMRPSPEITAPGINPAYLNVQNSLHPVPGYEAQFFLRIDKDILEPSAWEDLAPPGYRLSEGLYSGR